MEYNDEDLKNKKNLVTETSAAWPEVKLSDMKPYEQIPQKPLAEAVKPDGDWADIGGKAYEPTGAITPLNSIQDVTGNTLSGAFQQPEVAAKNISTETNKKLTLPTLSSREDRQYSENAFARVGGNAPILPSVSEQPRESLVMSRPEQAGQVQSDRRPVGYDGLPLNATRKTDSGLSVQFNPSVSQQARQAFMQPLGANDEQAQQARDLQQRQFLARNGYKEVSPTLKNLLSPGDLPGMSKRALREYNNKILENNNPNFEIQKDKNRIAEMETISQNKLRDIQGQVAQKPPLKERAYEPKVVKVPDGMGGTREEVMVPNEQGRYVSGMADQSLETPTEAAKALMIKNKNNPEYVNAYIKRFGKLPY